MRVLYDFKCTECSLIFEDLVDNKDYEVQCTGCGGTAKREQAAPRCKLDPISGHFPDALSKWEKLHTPKSRGGSGPEIDTYGMGTAR